MTADLFKKNEVKAEWLHPTEFPLMKGKEVVAIDLETCDTELKKMGPGWPRKMGKVTLFSPDGRTTEPLTVTDNAIICSSGEVLFTMERLSKREAPPIGDGTCDCGDCSDEPTS